MVTVIILFCAILFLLIQMFQKMDKDKKQVQIDKLKDKYGVTTTPARQMNGKDNNYYETVKGGRV